MCEIHREQVESGYALRGLTLSQAKDKQQEDAGFGLEGLCCDIVGRLA